MNRIRLAMTCIGLAVFASTPAAGESGERLEFPLGGSLANYPLLGPCGRHGTKTASFDGRGLRVKLAAKDAANPPIGVQGRFRLHGDFEVTATYELLAVGEPSLNEAVGVMLLLQLDLPGTSQASLARLRTPTGGVHKASYVKGGSAGKEPSDLAPSPAKANWGRLRLTRSGTRLQFAAADGGTTFQEVGAEDIGKEDVKVLRFVATKGRSQVPVDVRLLQLSIQSDLIANESPIVRPPSRVPWWVWLGGLGVGALASAAGVRLWLVRRRAMREQTAARPPRGNRAPVTRGPGRSAAPGMIGKPGRVGGRPSH